MGQTKWTTTNHTKIQSSSKGDVWWDWKGVLCYELLLENQMINSNKCIKYTKGNMKSTGKVWEKDVCERWKYIFVKLQVGLTECVHTGKKGFSGRKTRWQTARMGSTADNFCSISLLPLVQGQPQHESLNRHQYLQFPPYLTKIYWKLECLNHNYFNLILYFNLVYIVMSVFESILLAKYWKKNAYSMIAINLKLSCDVG